jgi:hypothetical protein
VTQIKEAIVVYFQNYLIHFIYLTVVKAGLQEFLGGNRTGREVINIFFTTFFFKY